MSFTRRKFKKKRMQSRKGGSSALSKVLYRQRGGTLTGTIVSVNRAIPANTLSPYLDPSLVSLITIAGTDISGTRDLAGNYSNTPLTTINGAVTTGGNAKNATLPFVTSVTTDSAGNMYVSTLKFIVKITPAAREKLYTLDESIPNATPVPIYPGVGIPVNNVKVGTGTINYPAGTPTIELLAGSLSTNGLPTATGNVSQPNIRFTHLRKIIFDKNRNCLYAGDAGISGNGDSIVKINLAVTPVTASILVNLTSVTSFGSMALDATGNNLFFTGVGGSQTASFYKYDLVLNNGAATALTLTGSFLDAFYYQTDIVGAPDGSFFTSNGQQHAICRVTPTGAANTYDCIVIAGASNSANTSYGDSNTAINARFGRSMGLAFDSKNNLYVFDSTGNNIMIYGIRIITFNKNVDGITTNFSSAGSVYTYFGGFQFQIAQNSANAPPNGTKGSPAVDGGPTTATMIGPGAAGFSTQQTFSGMYIDKYDNIYIADESNSMVRAISYPYTNVVGQSYLDSAFLRAASAAVQASSAVAQKDSSALAQSISAPRQSSAVIQQESSALASSAVAQNVSSALAQSISGARASSAEVQGVSSALAQSISGSQVSSAVAQNVSSALAQSISGAQTSSAVAQKESSAQVSSAVAQNTSSAFVQNVSSAVAQNASSAQQEIALSGSISTQHDVIALLTPIQLNVTTQLGILYSSQSSITDKIAALQVIKNNMSGLYSYLNDLANVSRTILSIAPKYQDRAMQTRVADPNIESQGNIKVYDRMRQRNIIVDAQQGYIIDLLDTPNKRVY